MGPSIIYHIDVSMVHHCVMPHPILLISFGVKNCCVQIPHGTHGIQHHFVPPEPFVQQMPTVGFVGQRTLEGGSLLLNAIVGLQHHMLVVPDSLVVLDQPNDHLSAKVSGWIEGVIMGIFVSNPQALLEGCKEAISITIHLQITPLVNTMDKATIALHKRKVTGICNGQGDHTTERKSQ